MRIHVLGNVGRVSWICWKDRIGSSKIVYIYLSLSVNSSGTQVSVGYSSAEVGTRASYIVVNTEMDRCDFQIVTNDKLFLHLFIDRI